MRGLIGFGLVCGILAGIGTTSADAATKVQKRNALVGAIVTQCKKLEHHARTDCIERAEAIEVTEQYVGPMRPEWRAAEWRTSNSRLRGFKKRYQGTLEAAYESLKK